MVVLRDSGGVTPRIEMQPSYESISWIILDYSMHLEVEMTGLPSPIHPSRPRDLSSGTEKVPYVMDSVKLLMVLDTTDPQKHLCLVDSSSAES